MRLALAVSIRVSSVPSPPSAMGTGGAPRGIDFPRAFRHGFGGLTPLRHSLKHSGEEQLIGLLSIAKRSDYWITLSL
jgi:hypothetical protein